MSGACLYLEEKFCSPRVSSNISTFPKKLFTRLALHNLCFTRVWSCFAASRGWERHPADQVLLERHQAAGAAQPAHSGGEGGRRRAVRRRRPRLRKGTAEVQAGLGVVRRTWAR